MVVTTPTTLKAPRAVRAKAKVVRVVNLMAITCTMVDVVAMVVHAATSTMVAVVAMVVHAATKGTITATGKDIGNWSAPAVRYILQDNANYLFEEEKTKVNLLLLLRSLI